MTSLRRNPLNTLKVLVLIVLILGISVYFGQVMGGFYLGNLARSDNRVDAKPGAAATKKILRLKNIEYYTIQAAAFNDQDSSAKVGKVLAEKGFPVVVTGEAPHQVLLGFVNDGSKLAALAESIQVNGQKAKVIKGQVNCVSFKFDSRDSFAQNMAAPFMGELSNSLEKGLLLYSGITTSDQDIGRYRNKFTVLARELDELAKKGENITADNNESGLCQGIIELSGLCKSWSEGLLKLESSWNDAQLVLTQQQALVLLEEYHRFINTTN